MRYGLCSVCGMQSGMYRDLIPSCFRQYLSEAMHFSYDFLPMCPKCYDAYRPTLKQLYCTLVSKYNVPLKTPDFARRIVRLSNGFGVISACRFHFTQCMHPMNVPMVWSAYLFE